jgi:hypothetical protein
MQRLYFQKKGATTACMVFAAKVRYFAFILIFRCLFTME